MTILLDDILPVNTDPDTDLSDPTFAPSDSDLEWVASTFNADADSYDVEPDDFDETGAAESAFLDAHELGMFSLGLAESLMARSIIGHMS